MRALITICALGALTLGAAFGPSASAARAQAGPGPVPQLTALVADVLAAPQPVPGSDGRLHLVYELRLANVTDGNAALKRIAIFGDDPAAPPLAVLGPEVIAQRLSFGGRRGSEAGVLGGFQFGVAFLHVALPAGAAAPKSLTHEITGFFDRLKAEQTVRLPATAVDTRALPVLGPPLKGSGYVVGDGCCDSTRHVRALLPLDGGFRLAQRFAVDWERIDAEGRLFRGEPKDPRSYHIYGAEILAVADGTVVAMRADLADQVPGALPPGLPLDEADGNFAVIDIGGGAFVLYAHMRPGSVRVRAGDRVRRGDVIGEVGNTGNSSAPHLHLHVMDGPSALLANGVPYVFDALTITAVDEAGTADFDRAEESGTPLTLTPRIPPLHVSKTLPLDLSIVDWGNAGTP